MYNLEIVKKMRLKWFIQIIIKLNSFIRLKLHSMLANADTSGFKDHVAIGDQPDILLIAYGILSLWDDDFQHGIHRFFYDQCVVMNIFVPQKHNYDEYILGKLIAKGVYSALLCMHYNKEIHLQEFLETVLSISPGDEAIVKH